MPKLTKRFLDSIPLQEAFYWDDELKGFGIKVTKTGIRFICQGRVNGRERRITLGKYGIFTTDQARKQARQFLQDMANGIDPVVERQKREAEQVTLGEIAAQYIKDRNLKPLTVDDINRHLNNIFSPFKDKPLKYITRDAVLKLFREKSEQSPAQANQAFRILRALINYAMATHRPCGMPLIPENPVQVLSDAKIWNNIKPKNRRIPLDKIGKAYNFLQGLRGFSDARDAAVDGVIFAMLTGARWNEIASLTWDDVDFDKGTWFIRNPKNSQSVTLPLSTQAQELLKNRPKGAYVFSTPKGKKGYPAQPPRFITEKLSTFLNMEISVHDLRRTFRSIAAELEIELWKTKLLMNHKINNDITISAYTEKSDLEYLRPSIQKISDFIYRQAELDRNKVVDITTKKTAL